MANTKKAPGRVKATVISASEPLTGTANIKKAETTTNINGGEAYNAGDWIEPSVRMIGYKQLVSESSILPQCIRAYKNNIAGFGIGIRYSVDGEETEEMKAEFDMAEEIIELLNVEQDTKEVF